MHLQPELVLRVWPLEHFEIMKSGCPRLRLEARLTVNCGEVKGCCRVEIAIGSGVAALVTYLAASDYWASEIRLRPVW
jgi:hypothetical protein